MFYRIVISINVPFFRALVVQFATKLLVYDSLTLNSQLSIHGCFKPEEPFTGTPAALGDQWLAYVDTKVFEFVEFFPWIFSMYIIFERIASIAVLFQLNVGCQSCGGASSGETLPSYAKQVLSAAKVRWRLNYL